MMERSDKARRSWRGLYVGTDLGTELGGYKGPISNQPSKSSELCPGSAFRAQKWGKEGNSIRGSKLERVPRRAHGTKLQNTG